MCSNFSGHREVVDIIVGSIDKFSGADGVNIESAGKTIKESLDKQYHPSQIRRRNAFSEGRLVHRQKSVV